MKVTKNIEDYVKNRVNELFTAMKIAEEKAEYDARKESRLYKTLLDKELAIAIPKLVHQICIDHGIDTEKYEITVRDMYVDISLNNEPYSKIKNNYGSIYTKILVSLEMEKGSDIKDIDRVINSILYPETESEEIITTEKTVETDTDTASDACKSH
jgi:hypothetical protein